MGATEAMWALALLAGFFGGKLLYEFLASRREVRRARHLTTMRWRAVAARKRLDSQAQAARHAAPPHWRGNPGDGHQRRAVAAAFIAAPPLLYFRPGAEHPAEAVIVRDGHCETVPLTLTHAFTLHRELGELIGPQIDGALKTGKHRP